MTNPVTLTHHISNRIFNPIIINQCVLNTTVASTGNLYLIYLLIFKKIKFYVIFFTLICNLSPGYGSGTVPEGLQRETEGFYYSIVLHDVDINQENCSAR